MKTILETKKSTDYYENIKVLLNSTICNHKTKVKFVLRCNEGLDEFYDKIKYSKVYESRQACLKLVETWFEDETKVNREELRKAADAAAYAAADVAAYTATAYAAADTAAYNAADSAANIAYIAACVAHAAYASYAVNAANAANAAYAAYAAYAAADAAYAAAKTEKYEELYNWLFEELTKGLNKETLKVLWGE